MFCSLCLHRVHDLKFKMLPKPAVVFGDLKKNRTLSFYDKISKETEFSTFHGEEHDRIYALDNFNNSTVFEYT